MFNIKLKNTTAIYCPFCHSVRVKHEEPNVFHGLSHCENYLVRCMRCGAKGLVSETWEVPEPAEGEQHG